MVQKLPIASLDIRCEEIFSELPLWKLVSDIDRREIYADVVHNLSKKEKEVSKALRKKNQERLADILDKMTKIEYKTTWEQAQQMLLDNPAFADDDELLAMDKEDALVTFEDHIRELEREWELERDKEKKRTKRLQRKNRDAMNAVLDELHEHGKLTSMSLWCELYPTISQVELNIGFDSKVLSSWSGGIKILGIKVVQLG